MTNYRYEEVVRNPRYLDDIVAEARRQRSLYIRDLFRRWLGRGKPAGRRLDSGDRRLRARPA